MKSRWDYKGEGFEKPPADIKNQASNPQIAVVGRAPKNHPYLRIEDFGVVVTLSNKARLRNLANAILTAIGDK